MKRNNGRSDIRKSPQRDENNCVCMYVSQTVYIISPCIFDPSQPNLTRSKVVWQFWKIHKS